MRVNVQGEASVQGPLLVGALDRPHLSGLQRKTILALFALGCTAAIALPAAGVELRYPGWFAVQRLTLILAPALIGLHYRRRRPDSRFGTLLILAGALAIPLSLQAASAPWLHLLGVAADAPLFVLTLVLVLTFPSGRARGHPRQAIVAAAVAAGLMWFVPLWLLGPKLAGGPVASCTGACPANPLRWAADTGLLSTLTTLAQALTITVILIAAAMVAARMVRSDTARRRALAIGNGPALVFLASFVVWLALNLGTPAGAASAGDQLAWILAVSRALIPFGYLLALLDAELYAGRVVAGIIQCALNSPDPETMIASLPSAVGTPSLGLGFWVPGRGWTCRDGRPLAEPAPDSGYVLTTLDREGQPMAAVVHSEQLEESPELIRAVVTTSMLIYENAALEAELRSAIRELRASRARVVKAGDHERRRIERDLHDGAQQRLISLGIKLKATSEAADGDAVLRTRIAGLCSEVDRALGEIRGLAHGIFPALLADLGLIPALRAAARNSPLSVRVAPVRSRRRYPADLEAAVYYCCLEALQNAGKHAGHQARVSVSLVEAGPNLRFSVRDDGCGFHPATVTQGDGMVGMRDRLGAIGGALRISSSPGAGTEISGTVPFGMPSTGPGHS